MGGSLNTVKFFLDGAEVEALEGETIWQAAKRHNENIPHLCYSPEDDYEPSGNCRACMVEIEGERTLAASCVRTPTEGMKVNSASSDKAQKARKLVMELMVADQPERDVTHDKNSKFWKWADELAVDATNTRFPAAEAREADSSHTSIAVNMDACITCQLCVQACRDVQVNEVIGLSQRGSRTEIVFDFNDPMGDSTCVACGECVQACPTGALMPKKALDDSGVGIFEPGEDVDRKVESVCPFCGVGCQISIAVKDDDIIYVEGAGGPSNRNRLCVKGRFGFDYPRHPDRLTKPLIRKEGIAKDDIEGLDPANPYTHFRDATWEEALDFAAGGLRNLRDDAANGPKSLAGFGSAKGSNEEAYMFQKLVRTGFQTNNVDHCTRLCHASSVAALLEGVGSGAVSASFMEVQNSEVAILIGCNPESNHPVAATFFKRAAMRGTKLIIMDPRGHSMKEHASHMLQFKYGADVSLVNAMMNVILEEGLYKQDFLDDMTIGFDQLKEHLKDFKPEDMAEVCGIDADTIREVARLYATAKSSIIFWGMGVSQHVHGTDNVRAMISMSMMTGQIGRPGTGLHPLRGQNNVQGASDAGLIPMMYPDYQPVIKPENKAKFEKLWGVDELDPNKGLTVVEIMDAVHDDVIKGMYIQGENPAMSDPDVNHAREALAKLEHLVVQDLFVTETAKYADVILPASAFVEKDCTVSNTNRQVQRGRAALPLPGDARQDWWLIQEVAKRLGLDWNYTSQEDVFNEMKLAMPSLNNITWERLTEENSVTYPCHAPDQPGQDVVFTDGFPTETGKATLVPAGLVSPDELPDEEYPMILSTGRVLEHWHTGSMTRRSETLDDLEPAAFVSVNPNDAAKMGVAPGDMVRVATRRGVVECYARVLPEIADGCLFMPFCFSEGAANELTNAALDPFGKIPEFKFCAAKIEKIA